MGYLVWMKVYICVWNNTMKQWGLQCERLPMGGMQYSQNKISAPRGLETGVCLTIVVHKVSPFVFFADAIPHVNLL